jgi:hypothetical protein
MLAVVTRRPRAFSWIFSGIVALLIVVAFSWKTILWTVLVVGSERPPELLSDVKQWDDPAAAVKFERRFPPGAPERELLAWVSDNRFEIDGQARRATRRIGSVPCNEVIEVDWSADAGGRLRSATATMSEAGCL